MIIIGLLKIAAVFRNYPVKQEGLMQKAKERPLGVTSYWSLEKN